MDLLQLLQATGLLGFVLLILRTGSGDHPVWIWAKVRDDERLVTTERLAEVRADRDEWKQLAQQGATTNQLLTGQLERLTESVTTLTGIVDQSSRRGWNPR